MSARASRSTRFCSYALHQLSPENVKKTGKLWRHRGFWIGAHLALKCSGSRIMRPSECAETAVKVTRRATWRKMLAHANYGSTDTKDAFIFGLKQIILKYGNGTSTGLMVAMKKNQKKSKNRCQRYCCWIQGLTLSVDDVRKTKVFICADASSGSTASVRGRSTM